jgi:single-strand DNA-binding protein
MYLNNLTVAGNVTRDAELKYSQNGSGVLTFSIGINKRYKTNGEKKEKSFFLNCVIFGKGAEGIAPYLTKGKGVVLVGELSIDSYTDKEGNERKGTKIIVREVKFTGGPASTTTENGATPEPETDNFVGDDEVPF